MTSEVSGREQREVVKSVTIRVLAVGDLPTSGDQIVVRIINHQFVVDGPSDQVL